MPITGFLESVSDTAIKGWCIDTSHDGVVDVELRIGSVSLASVHADLPRRDLQEQWDRTVGGFRFRVSPRLLSLLSPHERVEAWANGQLLRYAEGCGGYVPTPGENSLAKLESMLADGFFISSKSGGLHRRIRDRWSDELVFRSLARGNSVFKELFGKELFIFFGTLLGCIRNNDFIDHDDDVDVCFMSRGGDAEAAALEFNEVVRALRAHGERVDWPGNAHFHWNHLDVFTAWFEDGQLYTYNAGGECPEDVVLPPRTRQFMGRGVVVPNQPEKVLELIYGPGWRVPDPMFQWRVPPHVRRNLGRFSERVSHLLE